MPAPILFALDTAGERCSLALVHAGGIEERLGAAGSTHLEHVMPMIAELFGCCGLQPRDCAAFAFASGPGSFTGLRVACTIVQGLALGAGRPVIAIGHLEALADAAAQITPPPARRIFTATDARMGQAYWGVFEAHAGRWSPLAAPAVDDAALLPERIAHWHPDTVATQRSWFLRHVAAAPADVRDVSVTAAAVARLALVRLAQGQTLPAEQAVPAYVRDRVAQTVAERRLVQAERPA